MRVARLDHDVLPRRVDRVRVGGGGTGQVVVARDVRHDGVGVDHPVELVEAPVGESPIDAHVVERVPGRLGGGGFRALEPVEDEAAGELGELRLVGGARGEPGCETTEAFAEVHGDGEALVLTLESRLVVGGEPLLRLGHDPRRHGLQRDRVVGQVELEQSEVSVTALVGHLVVEEDLEDVVAEVVLLDLTGGAVEMAVQRHEDLVVAADEGIPQPLAVAGLDRRDLVRTDVDQSVRREDHRDVGVRIQHPLRPRDRLVRGVPRDRERHEALSLGLEDVVLAQPGRVASLVGRQTARALGPEPGGEGLPRRVELVVPDRAVGDVVVAGKDRVGQARVVEDRHGAVGRLPLARRPRAVDDVPEVRRERNPELVRVLGQPGRLRLERVRSVAGHELILGIAGVELRVWKDRKCETRSEIVIGRCRGRGRGARDDDSCGQSECGEGAREAAEGAAGRWMVGGSHEVVTFVREDGMPRVRHCPGSANCSRCE